MNEYTTELPLFEAAKQARDQGIERSSDTAGREWFETAVTAIRRYLENHKTMHVDDLWRMLDAPYKGDGRALGAAMKHASKEGWMEPIVTAEGYIAAKPSVRSNYQLKAVWRSLCCATDAQRFTSN